MRGHGKHEVLVCDVGNLDGDHVQKEGLEVLDKGGKAGSNIQIWIEVDR